MWRTTRLHSWSSFIYFVHKIIVFVSDVGNMIMFADDTNLFFSGLDFNCVCAFINQELIKIHNWFKANKISLLNKENPLHIVS